MAVPKKRTAISKKRMRKNMWKRKGYGAALKALSLGKYLSTGNSKVFLYGKQISPKISKKIRMDLTQKMGSEIC